MPSFDSIVVGENWISEHYFTTDSTKESFQSEVLKLRKQWDEQAKEGQESVLKRFLGERGTFQVELAELLEQPSKASDVYHKMREALGFKGTTADLTAERAGTTLRVPNVWESHNADVLFLESGPVESLEDLLDSAKAKMLAPAFIDDREAELSAPKLVSELFRTDEPPQFIVVFGGRWLLLTERERWAEGRYLAADLLLACERNDTKRGGEIDRILAIFGRESLLPDASESIWWNQTLENSIKHTIGVSKDLREGIRLSIEIIANDVLLRRQAQGLALGEVDGQILARQSLRYLYRILFLLYAEASPEMGVLPVGAGEYSEGYGLDRLRELTLAPLNSPQSRSGTHIYESLNMLFRLVDEGHHPSTELGNSSVGLEVPPPADGSDGLHFDSLKADLFDQKAMVDIDRVGLGNFALQKVLQHLLLSKEIKGRDRGFISYAELGVNQLGAVYEGLMSYTGFIAESDLYEVAKEGDSSKGSWVVPVERSESIDRKHFVTAVNDVTGELEPVLHEKGTFVFRLAGRERQQSASYYTPEILTRFVVSQALEELLHQGDKETAADDILKLTICEPALGSGAFAIEAVRQLADEYLKRKQKELDVQIPAEEYAVELQKVKAQIALHQVYGVDLNSTAVELAEVSLWLDTMIGGLQAPWFGLRLRRGNSLIGARRATYSRASVNDKSWLTSVPVDAPLVGLGRAMAEETDDPNVVGRIHHFLLPAAGWGAAAEAKEVKELAFDAQKNLKAWRIGIKAKPSKTQVDRLTNLARRVETLWQFTLRRLEVAELEARRDISFFGKNPGLETSDMLVSRLDIEQKLSDPNGAYQRLRRVMDAWNALWYWPLTEQTSGGLKPPSMDEWIAGLESVLGVPAPDISVKARGKLWKNQSSILDLGSWSDLNVAEDLDLSFAGVCDVESAQRDYPWLKVCAAVASEQGFFHWELDFCSVFARGGFDLQIGNPPWVRPDWDEAAMLSEHDPWWQLAAKATQKESSLRRDQAFADARQAEFLTGAATSISATREFLAAHTEYPIIRGLRPDLYRSFMERTWRSSSVSGVVALIHPESHFTEKTAGHLRSATYKRIRRHWQFLNIRGLFEIAPVTYFGVHVYGSERKSPMFMMAASIYSPDTIERSLKHDGSGEVPGLKDASGKWDERPHAERILTVDETVLRVWADILDEPETPLLHARMVYPINMASARVLEKLAQAPRVRELNLNFSGGWNETTDRKRGVFEVGSAIPEAWSEVIMQGPFFSIATPLDKQPNPTMRSKSDYTQLNLESLKEDFIPRTSFQRSCPQDDFSRYYTSWPMSGTSSNAGVSHTSAANFYRMVWRRMAQPANARTLQPAIIPPGPTHVDAIFSAGGAAVSLDDLILVAGACSSIVLDFWMKVSGITNIRSGPIESLPRVITSHPLAAAIKIRTLRLNCLTESYGDLWSEVYSDAFGVEEWAGGRVRNNRPELAVSERGWRKDTPLRIAEDRRQALLEIDALMAIYLGLTADELCAIYRTQFPVFSGYDRSDVYDRSGRQVPNHIVSSYLSTGAVVDEAQRAWESPGGDVYSYEPPFVSFDRETDMRQAYAYFANLINEEG